ncbi:DinB family protein [Roseivirga sp. BDSF3-8]|uniref:DinB family protein n=1 Tax=Roseivirga sp. BDSF3-8 TaxID=3241598 RepID=UPI003531C99D
MEQTRKELIRNLIERMEHMEAQVKSEFLHQPEEVLMTRPAPAKWSIGEVAAHTTLVMSIYLANIKEGMRANDQGDQAKPYRMGFNGRMMVKMLAPKNGKVKWKVPTFGNMVPPREESYRPSEHVDDLLTTLRNFREVIQECGNYDLNRVKVASAIGRIIRFRLGDAIQVIAAHNERHLVQMNEVLAVTCPAMQLHTGARQEVS